MLLRLQLLQRELLPSLQCRQLVLQLFVFFVLAFFRLLIDPEEPVKLHHRPGHAEPVNIAVLRFRVDVHRSLVKDRGHNLRRHKALPDQLVDLKFIFFQILFYLVGMPHRRGGPDGFVRGLCFLLLLICIRSFRQVGRAVFLANVFANFLNRFGSNASGVGTHVGDQTNQAFFAQFHTFIQPLRDHHGALHAEAQFAGRVLLQLAGGKRRRGIAAAFFLIDRANEPVGLLEGNPDLFRILAVRDLNLLFALA